MKPNTISRFLIALATVVFLPGLAWAQSSPGLFNGQVPTAAQWNSYFSKKADWPIGGFCADGSVFANLTGTTNSLRCTPSSSLPSGTATSAAKWTTARTLTVTGDVSLTIAGIDGSANFTGAATLPTVATAATCTYATVTLNVKGLVTSCSNGTAPGGGTVTTTGSPSSGQMAKFSGGTSITTAVSGTDYAPATSGSAILKGNGAGGFSSAAAGTDYVAATSGSSIQKANGSGGLTAAVAGTDYLAPSASCTLVGNAPIVASGSVASVSWPSIPNTGGRLRLTGSGRSQGAGTGTDFIIAQFNSDTGTNYGYQLLLLTGTAVNASQATAQTGVRVAEIPKAGNIANIPGSFTWSIPLYASTSFGKTLVGDYSMMTNTTVSSFYNVPISGFWTGTAAISSLTLFETSNFVAGSTFWLEICP